MNKKYDIGFEQALSLVKENISPIKPETVSISDAVGRIASEPVYAKENAPSLDSSQKDGYAVISKDIEKACSDFPIFLKVIGSISAGSNKNIHIESGQTVRILTGAPIPQGSDAVLAEEFTTSEKNHIKAFADAESGRNILPTGTDVRKGELLLSENTRITPSKISLLVAGGITGLSVYKKPAVGLLATGDEILLPGSKPEKGKLYASNMALQEAWLKYYTFPSILRLSGDSMQDLTGHVKFLISHSDAIITSGGAWKGDKDLIVKVLDKLGWKKIFHRVRMGPGKAIGFGCLDGKPVFCLPGGPPSNEMAFLMIAFPAICKLAGFQREPFQQIAGTLKESVSGKSSWTQFIHCLIQRENAGTYITPIKLRSRLASMAKAQAILKIPEGVSEIREGQQITVTDLDI